jgi:hypothetical protein
MAKRRDLLKLGLAAAGAGLLGAGQSPAQDQELLQYLCPPDGLPPDLSRPSPKAEPHVAELFVPPIKQPAPKLDPPPSARAHQRYNDFLPKKFYEIRETEFQWAYHPHPPYREAGDHPRVAPPALPARGRPCPPRSSRPGAHRACLRLLGRADPLRQRGRRAVGRRAREGRPGADRRAA